jgi:hypothetical protein
MFYHTEGKMKEEGVEWDGVVYGMDIGEWGSDWLEEDGLWEVGPYDVDSVGSLTPNVIKAFKILTDLHCHNFLMNLGAPYCSMLAGKGPEQYYGAFGKFVGPGKNPLFQRKSGAWGVEQARRGVEGIGMRCDLSPVDYPVEAQVLRRCYLEQMEGDLETALQVPSDWMAGQCGVADGEE